MIFKENIKKIISVLLLSLFLVSTGEVSVSAALADLAHDEEISLKVYKEKEDIESTAASCIADKAIIKKENGKTLMYITLTDNGDSKLTGYLNDIYYYKNVDDYSNDIRTNVNVIKTNDLGYPEEISIELTSDDKIIYIGFKIAIPSMPNFAMGHKARLIYDTEVIEDNQEEDKKEDDKENKDETSKFQDGLYEVQVELLNANKDEASMASSAIDKKALINIKDGKAEIYLSTKPLTMGTITASLQTLQYEEVSGTYTYAKVTTKSQDGTPTGFKFTLPSYEEILKVKVNPMVAMMGNRDISARLKIDYTTMTISSNSKLPSESEEKKEESTEIKKEEINNDKFQSSTVTNEENRTTIIENAIAESTETGDNSNVIPLAIIMIGSVATILFTRSIVKRRI